MVNLEVTNVVGETRIRGENDVDEITVEIERSATGLTKKRAEDAVDDIKVNVERKGNRYIIEVENFGNGGLFDDRSVKLLITVPEKLNITAENNVGVLSVETIKIETALIMTIIVCQSIKNLPLFSMIQEDGVNSYERILNL